MIRKEIIILFVFSILVFIFLSAPFLSFLSSFPFISLHSHHSLSSFLPSFFPSFLFFLPSFLFSFLPSFLLPTFLPPPSPSVLPSIKRMILFYSEEILFRQTTSLLSCQPCGWPSWIETTTTRLFTRLRLSSYLLPLHFSLTKAGKKTTHI
jgi:hypothetical protein